jgi:drug/metabolite transporter (DMT)-like permease
MEAILLVVLASAMFATSGPAAKVALAGGGPLAVAAARCALAAAILALVTRGRTVVAFRALPGRDLALGAASGAVLALHFACFTAGIGATSFAAAVTLVSLEPAVVLLAGVVVFGLRPTRLELGGLAVAALGAFAIARGGEGPTGEHRLAGDLLVLASVGLYGVYYSFSRALRERLPALVYSTLVYGTATLVLVALALGTGASLRIEGTRPLVAVAVLAVVATLGGHTLGQLAARRLRPAAVALMSPGETLGSVLVGAVVFGWWPAANEVAGCAAVLAGATLTILGTRPAAPVEPQSQVSR